MSALGHYLEEEGIATVAIALIRPQAENARPPRALWVLFDLGRPFGPPTDPTFQRRVILAALRLLEREDGSVVIEDFDRGWGTCDSTVGQLLQVERAGIEPLAADVKRIAVVLEADKQK